ncbi:MAG: hypothetical protein IKC64_04405 [Clostridia bacterium]|nr:hypothetical protein [Clostridia bacterium]
MKKFLKKLIACTFAAVTCFSVAACGDRDTGGEKKDETKIQIYVNNFYGGYGSDWLYGYGDGEDHVKAAKEKFQDMYADYEDPVNFPGKRGVQVMINDEKTSIMGKADTILGNDDEIYFAEYAYYYTLLQKDIMLDITDVVAPSGGVTNYAYANINNLVNPGSTLVENKTIESKFTAEQKDFYGVKETPTSAPKYYGITHYAGYTGLTYNVDLFDTMGAYFVDVPYENPEAPSVTYTANVPFTYEDYTDASGFLDYNKYYQLFLYNAENPATATLTAGPDGEYGNEDDGLPRTFDEFYILCHFLNTQGENPVAWAGAQIGDYVTYLVNALAVEYEGLDQAKLAYTFDGTAKNLGTVDASGNWVDDATDTVISETEAEVGNGYELVRQRGRYEALKFLQNLLFGKGKVKTGGNGHDWVSNSSFVSTTSHMNQQDNFLDTATAVRACMLVEGAWWESEATNTFVRMGEGYGKMDRNFSFMALPNANAEEYQKKVDGDKNTTLFDHIYSLAFIKSNINPAKVNIAKDFLRFVYSDPQLIQYTQITNTPKALNYTMSNTDLANCSTYGKSLMRMKQTSDVLYPYSQHDFYMANQGSVTALSMFWSEISEQNKQYPCSYFWEDSITSETWFNGMYDYQENRWESLHNTAYGTN